MIGCVCCCKIHNSVWPFLALTKVVHRLNKILKNLKFCDFLFFLSLLWYKITVILVDRYQYYLKHFRFLQKDFHFFCKFYFLVKIDVLCLILFWSWRKI